MPTADPLVQVTAKKLLGYIDFEVYLKQYLVKAVREATKRLFIQGSFDERMPLSSPGADQIQVDLKPTYGDGFAHDGSGRLLDLEQIDRTAYFENVGGQTYEVGAEYIEYPSGIRVNPRTGKYEFDHMVEGIGRQAIVGAPDTVGLSTLTFVVDPLFEEGVSPGDHTGRLVRVFTVVPGDAATSESIAIETCTVFYDGQNKITTAGFLGETVPGTAGGWYMQLIGITVFRDTATNKPSLSPTTAFFLGTVDGNDATPSAFDITGQNVISAQSAALITLDPLPNWFDGTTNTETDVQAALEKIVSDLATYNSGDIPTAGAEKIATTELPLWYDGSGIPADSVQGALYLIVDHLGEFAGGGAARVSAAALPDFADATTTPIGSVQDQFDAIVNALTSTTGGRGAGKLTAPALSAWADGTTNPAARVDEVLAKVVTDLTSTTGQRGAGKLTAPALDGGYEASIAASRLDETLQALLNQINSNGVRNDRRAELIGVQSLKKVFTNPSWTLNCLDYSVNSLFSTANIIAVGDHGSICSRIGSASQWTVRTPAAGFTDSFNGVAVGNFGTAIVGNSGEIQTSSDLITWTRRMNGGSHLRAIAFAPATTSTGRFVAVGDNGDIFYTNIIGSFAGATWNPANVNPVYHHRAIIYANGKFVTTMSDGTIYYSTNGSSWTQAYTATIAGSAPAYLVRALSFNLALGFTALFTTSGSDIGIASSPDGITWSLSSAGSSSNFDEANCRLAMLDRQIVTLSTVSTSQPYSLYAIVQENANSRPNGAGLVYNVFDIGECFPFFAKNVNGVLFVCGRLNNGDGVILSGASFRPNGIYDLV